MVQIKSKFFFDKINSHAKINLSLNVIKRLPNNYHNIESLVTFAKLSDTIYIRLIKSKKHIILFQGKFSKNISKNNTISKLLRVLDKKKLLNNNKFKIKVIKNIPQKSGMGGGSMNAASLLDYFLKKRIIKISIKEIYKIADFIGSDVALGLQKKNTILFANKSLKKLNFKTKIHVLLVKPDINYSTKFIYSKVRKYSKQQYKYNYKAYFSKDYLVNSKNDLETIVLNRYPKIKILKKFLTTLPGLFFVRMTGSGSTIVAYFKSKKGLDIATRIFKKQYNNYWSIKSKTI
jgi:4-diphosphocytidyl-2-C-methyl-D-erythritol kinase